MAHMQVRRRMEEENRKARKAARRDFNDNVRELASFVRRRDKRVSFFQVCTAQMLAAASLWHILEAILHSTI